MLPCLALVWACLTLSGVVFAKPGDDMVSHNADKSKMKFGDKTIERVRLNSTTCKRNGLIGSVDGPATNTLNIRTVYRPRFAKSVRECLVPAKCRIN